MFIKEIVIDGFKSYGQRTEIKGFDHQFNAITGLNGSGKSNILDSICFVLGISNLTQVRANSLQDLIYKKGQTGVTKATVSIVFDNRNPNQSPPGFENFEEITVTRQVIKGGKNKYLINGLIVQNKRVQDFFCSVQLNVNNPHFLIMQGRITKVLNMKPQEILSMIEEAAGTRMYESKRIAAQKTIEKKQTKLQELDRVIKEEVGPKLEKLREERSIFMEYQRLERELEYMAGLFHAYQFYATQRREKEAEVILQQSQKKIEDIKVKIKSNNESIVKLDEEISNANKDQSSSGKLEQYEEELKSKEKEEIKVKASEKGARGRLSNEEKKLAQLEKAIEDDENSIKKKENELTNFEEKFAKLRQADEEDTKAFQLSQKKFEAVSAGMEINEDGEAATLQEQLMKAQQEASTANTEIKQAEMELVFSQRELKEKQKNLGGNMGDYEKNKNDLNNIKREVDGLQKALSKINYSEERMAEISHQRRQLNHELRNMHERMENFEAQRPHTRFFYRDPEPNFNRQSVHGVVCKLIKMKDPLYATALETVAGGKLYNIVIETDTVGKKLLQKGQLQNRVTFIPLNKIQCTKIDHKMEKFAQNLVGKDNVQSALSLVNYDRVLQPAMEFVFGNAFVCKDLNVARQIAFHDQIRKRCITIEGDVVDPSGSLSGGARQKGGSVLLQLQEILSYEKDMKDKENTLRNIENEFRSSEVAQENYMKHKRQLEIKQHEMELLERQLQQTTHAQQQQEVENLKNTIENLNTKIKECKEKGAKNAKLAKEIEAKMKDSKGHREKQLKEAEAEMKRLKAKAENSKKTWKQHEESFRTLNLEIEELKKAIESSHDQIKKTQAIIIEINKEIEGIQENSGGLLEEIARLKEVVKEEKDVIAKNNKRIMQLTKNKEGLVNENTELELEIKRQEHEVAKCKTEFEACKVRKKEAEKRIKPDNKYMAEAAEMNNTTAAGLEKRIKEAQDQRAKLGRTVNTKAQAMYQEEEKLYVQLQKKKTIVENDRKKLLLVIADLDKKTKDLIESALQQITKDFGSIFSTLLPGSNSRLVAINKNKISDGLEVKVFLGGVWKENLTELSGGQRSLVALSLVLAMLLFKPAPLYILDEIDAALDLSHTQNIGTMLKAHFTQSQFIIVSLKDGMFNNANVLFRTKFVDGMSTVQRTVNRSA